MTLWERTVLFWRRCLRAIASWLLSLATAVEQAEVNAGAHDPVEGAVRAAAAAQGLPVQALSLEYDLLNSGKLPQVLYHAAITLDRDHSIRTLGDVVLALKGHR